MTMRVLLVDDEALARRRLRRLLSAHADVTVIAECNSGKDAVAALKTHAVDAVFLDVQMPGTDGFGVVQAVGPEHVPFVIFVTAYDDYALRAFEVHAVDYLLKPVSAARLEAALARIRRALADRESVDFGQRMRTLLAHVDTEAGARPEGDRPSSTTDRIAVKQGDRVVFVRVADIDWFEANGNYVQMHTSTGVHSLRQTMNELEASLDPARFARIHRSVIVNLDRVAQIEPWFAGDQIVVLSGGHRLKMSRTYREQVMSRIQIL